MPLPVFDKQADVPEAFRSEYEERDGKWHPKADNSTAEELAAEKRKRAALLDEKKEEKRLREAAEAERDALKRAKDAADKGITEEQLQKIKDDEAKARKPIEDENATLKAENRKLKLTDRVKVMALAAGVMPDRIEKAMKDLEGRVDLAQGGDTIVVKNTKGEVTTESIEDFLGKTYKAEASFFYGGTGSSGSGAEGSNGGSGSGSYDPVAAGKAAAAEQKAGREQNALAFR